MSWHIDQKTLDRYQEGVVDRVIAASVEAHVTDCDECRSRLRVGNEWLQQSWLAVADRVEPGRVGVVERVLAGLGVPSHLARLVVVSPVIRAPFLIALVLVLAFAVVVSSIDSPRDTFHIFLAVAPLLPVAGVAFAYGPLVDPAHEMALAAPLDSFLVLLLRAATVLSVAVALSFPAWTLVPVPGTIGVTAWLLPALALTVVTLAAASRFELWAVAGVLCVGWPVLVSLSATRTDVRIFSGSGQLSFLVVAALAAGVIVLRRNSYSREGGGR